MSNSFTTQGKALPDKVRQEIVKKWLHNVGIMEILRQLGLPYKSVSDIVDLWITTGSFKLRCPNRVDVNRTARTDDVIAYTEYTKINKPSTYAKEIQQQLQKDGVCLPENVPSKSAISRILNSDLGYSYKKLSVIHRETERDDVVEKLQTYIAEVSAVDVNCLHFFDESSVVITSGNRSQGHSAVGKPPFEVQRYASNANFTVNLLHNVNGISHFNILRGPSNGLELLQFFEEALEQVDAFENPIIKVDDLIVMDNCGFHHGRDVEPNLRQMLHDERRVHLMYQPPYHPCFNTCEQCFHLMKTVLRRYTTYTEKYTELCISDALQMITAGHSRQFFKFCGYL